jgi:GTP-binding protein Era
MNHKAGFVNIIGKPNVGKSTIMNALVGESLSIITHKAQTTRHRIQGIVNHEDYQIVFSDTPGIIKAAYALHDKMMHFVEAAFTDADILIVVFEANEKLRDEELIARINTATCPVFVLINKIDLSTQEKLEEEVSFWKAQLNPAEIIPLSAKEKFNTDTVLRKIIEYLPESPPYFPKDALTDKSQRFFVSEIIREKILLYYSKEIPYSVEVIIDTYTEEETIDKIRAVIYVSRESQKGIIIGHKGEALKRVGTSARIDMEKFLQKKVFLELFVKVHENWRDDAQQLKRFGYSD